MHVLLTGATGFIGSFVARALLEAGHEVRVLARRPAQAPAGLGWVTGDLTDPASLVRAASGVEAVIHVAAVVGFGRATAEMQRHVNVRGTRALLDAAAEAGVRRFVFTSSVAALGPPRGWEDEDVPYDWPPGMPYHESKRDSEREALAACARGLEVVALCPSIVLGPGEAHIGPLLRALRHGLLPLTPPGGTTLCDVRDVAAAHLAALERGRPGERYILGGVHITYHELARHLAQALGAPRPRASLPVPLIRVLGDALGTLDRLVPLPVTPVHLQQFLSHRYYSSAKAERELGYRNRPVEEMIRDTIGWYRAQGVV